MFCQVQFPVNIMEFGKGSRPRFKSGLWMFWVGTGMQLIFILYSTCLDSLDPRHLNKALTSSGYTFVCACLTQGWFSESCSDLLPWFIRLHLRPIASSCLVLWCCIDTWGIIVWFTFFYTLSHAIAQFRIQIIGLLMIDSVLPKKENKRLIVDII